MTPQEIIEGNKLIASFMGYEKSSEDKDFVFYKHPDGKGIVIQSQHDYKVFHTHELIEIKGFIFHRSWDWLMPVVEKIMDYCFENDGEEDLITEFYDIRDTIPDIHRTWSVCIDFIKWYNQNKQS